MLLDTKLTDEQSEYLRTIHVSAITLGNIFNDIIDLDKSDRSRLELSPQRVQLPDFITEIENISGLMAHQKGLRFTLDRVTELPSFIEVDGTRLRQILWNLVGNAVKFTKRGAVNVSVACLIEDQVAHLHIDVEDTGIGIPDDELENIFAMYYQVKQGSDNLHAVGTGIGLAVSRQLAQLMQGDIHVESESGAGSVFTLTVSVPILGEPICETQVQLTQTPLNIFLVEDIELNITVAKNLLESFGHTVSVARDGEEALALFDAHQFDLVFLDIQLPDMTGFEIAKHLRSLGRSLPPLVALTANVIKDKSEYIQQGMDDAISKPINVAAVKRIIDQWAGNRAEITSSKMLTPMFKLLISIMSNFWIWKCSSLTRKWWVQKPWSRVWICLPK